MVANNYGMILNGLKGADLIIFNLLYLTEGRIQLTAGQISYLTNYHPNTVFATLKRLEDMKMIERHRERQGQKYFYKVTKGAI